MRTEELLAQARADKDISGEPGVGGWQATDAPITPSGHPDGEVMVGRSVRMPLAVYEQIRTVAGTRGTTVSGLIRQWIDDGLELAGAETPPDPVAELHRTIDAATRALKALEGGRAA